MEEQYGRCGIEIPPDLKPETQRGGKSLPVVQEAWKELRSYRRFARTGTVTVGKTSSVVESVRVASREPGSASALTTTVT